MRAAQIAALAAAVAAELLRAHKEPADTYGLGSGDPIRKELARWFRAQEAFVLERIGEPVRTIPGEPPSHLPGMGGFTDPMSRSMTPIISAIWESSGRRFYESIHLDPDQWTVTNPHTQDQIDRATFQFCQETNATTSRQLEQALDDLRKEMAVGIVEQGEGVGELTKRVKSIFDAAETWRARRIAITENSRARHSAEDTAARESGVVDGWQWLVSEGACPLCHYIASEVRQVRLGQNFAVIGSGVYSQIRTPPAHPHCTCSIVAILSPGYGGPEATDWGNTAVDPDTSEYEYQDDPDT